MSESPLRKLLKDKDGNQVDKVPAVSPSIVSKPDPFLLDFELVNGNHVAMPYTSLLWLGINPSAQIVILFATHTVTIRGVCLKPIYNALLAQGASTLKAVGDRLRQYPDGVPIIVSIEIVQRTGTDDDLSL